MIIIVLSGLIFGEMFESDTRYTKYFIKRNLTGLSLSDKSSSQDEISEERSDRTPPSEQQQQSQDRDQEEKQMQDRTQTPAEDCTDNFRSRINSIKRKTVPLYEVIINGISIIFRFVGIVFSVIVGISMILILDFVTGSNLMPIIRLPLQGTLGLHDLYNYVPDYPHSNDQSHLN